MTERPGIDLLELERITHFLEARSQTSSARDIESWCEAREVDAADLRRYVQGLARSALATIATREQSEDATRSTVEAAFAAVAVVGFQVGIDSERRRRDQRELPL